MEYIASISYGKDSLAMLEVICEHGMKLDRIVHVEIMATDDIPADLPEVVAWKHYADKIILDRYGIEVEHVRAGQTYEEMFYQVPKRRGKNAAMQGRIKGFPSLRSQWCSEALKIRLMRNLFRDAVQYIGIAADEVKRHSQLSDSVRSPLVEHGVVEAECMVICDRLGLLAPNYLQSKRSGCWFCHAQPIDQLRLLRKNHPLLCAKLLEWDRDSPIPFRHTGIGKREVSVADFDKRFALEEQGRIPKHGLFKWSMLPEYAKQEALEMGDTPLPEGVLTFIRPTG